ncbi:MAG: hypothetical protein AAGI66_08470 [Cyanobacteria bacterium P01_H01_bin.74]
MPCNYSATILYYTGDFVLLITNIGYLDESLGYSIDFDGLFMKETLR